MSQNKSKICLITSMVIFGTLGVIRSELLYSSAFVAMVRGLLGAVFLAIILLIKKEKVDKKALKKKWITLVISGIMIAVNWMFLFEAYEKTSIATATICYYMAPAIVIVLAPIFLKEKITPIKFICIIFAIIGMTLVSGIAKLDFSHIDGIAFGIAAAFVYAGIVLLNHGLYDIPPLTKTVIQLAVGGISMIPFVLFTEKVSNLTFTPKSIILLIVAGFIYTGVAYLCYFASIPNLKTQTVAILSYIDPSIAVLCSVFILGEGMDFLGVIGVLFVIGAMLLSEILDIKKANK